MTTQIILASASPARAKLLKDAQIPHVVAISGVDEEDEKYSKLSPSQLVGILAMAKAQALDLEIKSITSQHGVRACHEKPI